MTALLWLLVTAGGLGNQAETLLGFIPARLSGLQIAPAVPAFLTPLTATLVHADLLHLLSNLVMLLWCGVAVERILGRSGLSVLYVVGAFVSAGAQYLVDPQGMAPMIGASGAISAVVGAFSLSFGRPKPVTGSRKVNVAIHAAWLLAAWVVLQILIGMVAGGEGYLLATPAHIGGFIAGLAIQRPLLLWRYRKA